MKNNIFNALALVLLLSLAACGQAPQSTDANHSAQTTQDTDETTSSSVVSEKIRGVMQAAKKKLATKNISVNTLHLGNGHSHKDSLSKAEITPQGELLIAGKEVAATPAQRTLLLDYREQIVGIAEAGMDIGTQGADLGIQAAKQALWGAFTSKNDKDIEATIKPQTDAIKAAALQLCQRLPDLLSSQQKLAAAMPEFQPYATMEQNDIDDCGKEMSDKNGKRGFAIFSD